MPLAFDIPVFRFGIVFVSSTLYGLFFILFVLSVLILHQQNKKLSLGCTSSTSVYLAFSYMTLVVLTAVWAISVVMCFKPALVDAPYIENYNPLMFSQHIIGYLAAIIGDTVMTYRLYIIWDRKRIILYISAILLPSAIGFILWGVIHYAMFGQVNQIPNIILASMTISVNVSCTSLIVWKIWDRNRLARAVGGEKVVLRLLAILVESSALYTGWIFIFLITHFLDIDLSQVFLYGLPHVAGIASMLINVRVGLGWAVGEEGRSTRSLSDSIFARSRPSHDSITIDV